MGTSDYLCLYFIVMSGEFYRLSGLVGSAVGGQDV